VAATSCIHACGPGIDRSNFSLFFNPFETEMVETNKGNFLYTIHDLTYSNKKSQTQISEHERNVDEWCAALGIENKESMEQLIHTNQLEKLSNLLTDIQAGKEVKTENKALQEICKKEEYLTYFILLQDYTYNVKNVSDEWTYTYHVNKADSTKMLTNTKSAHKLYKSLSTSDKPLDLFFKTRLAYHIIRMPFFSKQYALAGEHVNTYAKECIAPIHT